MTPHIKMEIPANAPEGFGEWLKFIQIEANNPECSISAGDVIKPFNASSSCTNLPIK